MNPNELRMKKADLLAQAKAINAELSDPKSDLTDEQRAKRAEHADRLLADTEALEAKAVTIEAAEQAARDRAERIDALSTQAAPKPVIAPDQPSVPRVEGGEPGWKADPMKGFKTHAEFFKGVMTASTQGRIDDPRLQYLATAGTDEQQVGNPVYGGFLVPEAVLALAPMLPMETDPFVGRTSPLPMDRPVVKIPAVSDKTHTSSSSGGLTVARSSETATKTASRMALEQVTFTANSLFGFSYATEELLQDSPTSVAALLAQGFGREFGRWHVLELLTGTGVGQPEGVQNNPALISVSKETGQVADTIVWNNIVKMTARCYGYGQAIWLYNHNCYPQLKTLTMPVGTGGVALWETASTVINGNAETVSLLNGRPAYPTEFLETVGDKNDIMLIVPSAIHEGTYQPLASAESMHVRFTAHERAFKFWTRNDARSLWRAALTPDKGDTLSPFVTLNARA